MSLTSDAKQWQSTRDGWDGKGAGNAENAGNAGDAACKNPVFIDVFQNQSKKDGSNLLFLDATAERERERERDPPSNT